MRLAILKQHAFFSLFYQHMYKYYCFFLVLVSICCLTPFFFFHFLNCTTYTHFKWCIHIDVIHMIPTSSFSANTARIQPNTDAPTIAELLMIRMDGLDQTTRRKSLKQLLGLTSMVCCGAIWENEEPLGPAIEPIGPPCVRNSSAMNLAAALAAERMGSSPERPIEESSPVDGNEEETPARVSLMRLLEEADTYSNNYVEVEVKKEEKGVMGCDSVCCVCMGRKKGAAFIPCGHTFCRVCSRELWLNRGSCPLCNRVVLEILDIY